MTLIKIIDELGRINRYKAEIGNKETKISHTYSYLYAREMMKYYPSEKIGLEMEVKCNHYVLNQKNTQN